MGYLNCPCGQMGFSASPTFDTWHIVKSGTDGNVPICHLHRAITVSDPVVSLPVAAYFCHSCCRLACRRCGGTGIAVSREAADAARLTPDSQGDA